MAQRPPDASASAHRRSRFLDHYLPFLMVRADELISRQFHEEVRTIGFTVPEWRLLATLYEGDGLPLGVLAELAVLPQPTASRWVDKLEAQGLVGRTGGEDRRRTIVHITSEGRRHAVTLVAAARKHQRRVVAALEPAQVAELTTLLRALIDSLEADDDR